MSKLRTFSIICVGAATVLPLLAVTAPVHALPLCGPTVTVQSGDTFYAIAQRCGVSVAEIVAANRVHPRRLQVGQALQLSAVAPAAASATAPEARTEPALRRVNSGETLADIARSLGTNAAAVRAANPHIDPNVLMVGQVIHSRRALLDAGSGREVTGVLKGEGGECRQMMSKDGELFTLVGEKLESFAAGDTVEVFGAPPELSICRTGTTIVVQRVRLFERPGPGPVRTLRNAAR